MSGVCLPGWRGSEGWHDSTPGKPAVLNLRPSPTPVFTQRRDFNAVDICQTKCRYRFEAGCSLHRCGKAIRSVKTLRSRITCSRSFRSIPPLVLLSTPQPTAANSPSSLQHNRSMLHVVCLHCRVHSVWLPTAYIVMAYIVLGTTYGSPQLQCPMAAYSCRRIC